MVKKEFTELQCGGTSEGEGVRRDEIMTHRAYRDPGTPT